LVTYCEEGPEEGLYVPAERLVRTLAREYHYSIFPSELTAVVELIRDSARLLTPSRTAMSSLSRPASSTSGRRS
jgi:hypothetical protein